MDIAREHPSRSRTKRIFLAAAALVVILVLAGVSRLRPATRPVDRNSIVTARVGHGALRRDVRATGTLVAEEVRTVAAPADGRVERIRIQPGAAVTEATVLLDLVAPEQQESASNAAWDLRSAEADLESLRAQIDSEVLGLEASVARLRAEHEQARLRAEADRELAAQGLVAEVTRRISSSAADELGQRLRLEEQRLAVLRTSQQSRLASQRAQLERRRARSSLEKLRVDALSVRAAITGVLQRLDVEEGQRVSAGAPLARVIQPERLIARTAVAEMQARDITAGQGAVVEINGTTVQARVVRIDPAVRNGTVLVDLALDKLPRGARADLTVDASIALETLRDVHFVTRPVAIQEGSDARVYRLSRDGSRAELVPVTFGRSSSTSIEVRSGLSPGDEIIVSDTTSYDGHNSLRIE